MATLKIRDLADEFRIEIIGRFAGCCIREAGYEWERALNEASSRKIVVDITCLSGYDTAGRQLLADMQLHGTTISAGTPLSLVFLHEITDTPRPGLGPVLKSAASETSFTASAAFKTHAAGD